MKTTLVRGLLILALGVLTLTSSPLEAQGPRKRTFRIMWVADGESGSSQAETE